jgi:DNA-binding protein HU-beta
MNKKDFIEHLVKAGDFKLEVAEGVYKVFVETLKSAFLTEQDKVAIPEIGKFEIKIRKARNGINPNTGEKISIPEKKTITFKPSKEFLVNLNQNK